MAVAECRAMVAPRWCILMDSPKVEAMFFRPFWVMVGVPQEGSAGDLQEFFLHTVQPPAMNRGYYPTGGYGIPPGSSEVPPVQANVQQPDSNIVKHFSTWNVCYLCSLDVTDGHTSMS